MPDNLTPKQIGEIRAVYFDEVRELAWKLKQARAKKRGSDREALLADAVEEAADG